MRNLEFRAWDGTKMWKVNKLLMGAHGGSPFQAQGIRFEPVTEQSIMNICEPERECKEKTPHCELMQFTGLKDKNGVEIYEGDILRWVNSDWTMVVSWEEMSSSGGFSVGYGLGMGEHIVIGNIYEHPNLLSK